MRFVGDMMSAVGEAMRARSLATLKAYQDGGEHFVAAHRASDRVLQGNRATQSAIAGLDPAIHAETAASEPLALIRSAVAAGRQHGPPGQARW